MSQTADEGKVKLTAYAKVDGVHGWPERYPGIPVLVRVVAPKGTLERVPVDLVAVLDVSCGSGSGMAATNKMGLLKKAMELIIGKLNDKDRLAIIPVQSSAVEEKDDLLVMTADGRTQAIARVEALAASSDNKLSTALKKAITKLEGRSDEEKKKAGFIVLISDGDDTSIFSEALNPNYSIHAFGFRDAHSAMALHHIANSSTGTYGILNDEHDRISEAFKASVHNMTSVIAVQAEVDVAVQTDSSAATLSAIESGRFKSHVEDNRKAGHVNAGALQAGAVRNFIFYVDNVPDDERDDLPGMLAVRVKYFLQPREKDTRVEERTNGEVVVVRKDTAELSREVAAEIVRVEAVRIVGEILDRYKDSNGKGLAAGADELRDQWCRLKESVYGREAAAACLISGLAAEMQEMETRMRRCTGLSYMLSWQTCHTLQHQTTRRAANMSSPAAVTAAAKGNSQVSRQNGVEGSAGKKLMDMFAGGGCAYDHAAHAGMEMAEYGDGAGGVKRKYGEKYTELEMIERRLAYWSKVKFEMPPLHHAGERPDHTTMVFQDASSESIDRAIFHDVFLAVVLATGSRKGSKSGECSCGSGKESRCHLDSCKS